MKNRFLLLINSILIIILACLIWAEVYFDDQDSLAVHFLDVGQGDATLIDYKGRFQILVDGGPNGKDLLSQLSKVMSPLDKKIEVVILTHPDSDHLAGLVDLFDYYQVEIILDNGQISDSRIFNFWDQEVEKRNIQKIAIGEGSSLSVGENLKLDFLHPDNLDLEVKNKNTGSVVFKMSYYEKDFLFTGDADYQTEKDLAFDWQLDKVDFLKVAHHGAKSSTSLNFLKSISPEIAVISAGRSNRYGHPNQLVLDLLKNQKIEIFRTDQVGTVSFVCILDGCVLK